jgi:DNA-binding NarL/FixJ family response regulator
MRRGGWSNARTSPERPPQQMVVAMISAEASRATAERPVLAAIQLVLADGQEFVRSGLRSLLRDEPGIALVGEATSCSSALALVAETRPDVVAVSYELPGDLSAFVHQVRAQARDAAVILYGIPPSGALLLDALYAGVKGFVDHVSDFRDLLAAVFAVAAGSIVIAPGVVPQLGSVAAAFGFDGLKADRHVPESLTGREREVLEYVAAGVSNRATALAIGLSEHTVRAHLRGIMRKLNARSRVQAVSVAIQRGVIAPPSQQSLL